MNAGPMDGAAEGVPAGGTDPTVVPFQSRSDRAREAPRVAEHLRAEGLILYPTETVYGLGCALRPAALDRLAALKGRERNQPFLLLADDPHQLEGLRWTDDAKRLADAFWPGPLTLVLQAEPGVYPSWVVGRGGTVAVRVSPHPAVRAVLHALGEPITSSSANRPSTAPVRGARAARSLLDELDGAEVVWVLDGGTLPASPPSTLVDSSGTRPRVLRQGALSTQNLRTVVKDIHG